MRMFNESIHVSHADWVETKDMFQDIHNQQDGFIGGTNPIAALIIPYPTINANFVINAGMCELFMQ